MRQERRGVVLELSLCTNEVLVIEPEGCMLIDKAKLRDLISINYSNGDIGSPMVNFRQSR